MSHLDYLKEVLSIQCEQAYGTVQRMKDMPGLSVTDRDYLRQVAEPVLIDLRDKFRIVPVNSKNKNIQGEGEQ